MNSAEIIFIFLGSLLFTSQADDSSPSATDDSIESHIHRSHTTNQGQKVLILDSLFTQQTLDALQTLILYNSPWQLQNDQEFPTLKQTPSPSKGELEDEGGTSNPECSAEVFPWSVQIPTAIFIRFNVWTRLKECLRYATDADDYLPYDITAAMLQRGTTMNATCAMDPVTDNHQEYVFRLFLTPDHIEDDHQNGDLTLFRTDDVDTNHSGEDDALQKVLLNVQSKYGRIALLDASIPYLSHPPGGDVEKSLFLTLRCTRDKRKVKESQKKVEAKLIERDSTQFYRFPKLKHTQSRQNWSNKITKIFQDKGGRSVCVFDKLFGTEDLDALRMYMAYTGPHFIFGNQVSEKTLDDKGRWRKLFEPEDFVHSEWWILLSEIVAHASPGRWYPYDVAFNIGAPTDPAQVHQDCDPREGDLTFVMYLNSDETAGFCGKTTFFDEVQDVDEGILILQDSNDEDSVTIGVVNPSYGRAVVYKGGIPYSTDQSSSTQQGVMPLSFVVKMANSRKQAIANRIRKILEEFPRDLTKTEEDLLQELSTSSRSKQHPLKKSERWLMEELNRLVVKMDGYTETLAKKARGRLLAKL